MKIFEYPSEGDLPNILQRPLQDDRKLDQVVSNILQEVLNNGDKAIVKFSREFDGVELKDLRVTEQEIIEASHSISKNLKESIFTAKKNIEKFHQLQLGNELVVETMPGVECRRKSVPIENIGLYIPGGSAPLFSTVLMLGIPAILAGCSNIVICTPCNDQGKVNPAILFTASVLGLREIYKIGGAQAIGALAYGTETIPKVDKVFGPGNRYVTKAKQLVSMEHVAIDMPAGPSEVLVVVDEHSNPIYAAADLLAQAEHGPDSQVMLLSTSPNIVKRVMNEMELQLTELPRKDVAQESIEKSAAIIVKDRNDLLRIMNLYGPEHLILSSSDADDLADHVVNAGSVFIGEFTPESAGDYASGTNHTLPTNGWAKSHSGVSVDSFMKQITFQKITEKGLALLGPVIETLAEAESLQGHKNAVSVRLKKYR